jgi:type I restriction enzyme, S subunit
MKKRFSKSCGKAAAFDTANGLPETVPEGWTWCVIRDVAQVRYGKGRPKTGGAIPVIGSSGIYGSAAESLISFPTVVVGRKGNAGMVWLSETNSWPSDTTFYLDWAGEPTELHYLKHCFEKWPLSGEHAKTTLPSLQKADLEEYRFPYPPPLEQRAIAAVLRTVQRAKEACEKVIAATRVLKQSLLHHLFTYGPVRFDQADRVVLKETKVGMVPEHWRTAELGDNTRHCAFGPRFSGDLYDPVGNVATLRTTDIADDGRINYLTMPRARIDGAKFASHFLKNGDFLVTRSGTCGIASVFDGFNIPVLAGAFLIRFVLSDEVFPYFLRDYFNSLLGRRRIEKIASGAVQKNISGTSLKAFLIPLPKIVEQREIASHLSAVDAKLAAEEKRRVALDNLFRSLLHNLMTGACG